MAEDPRLAARVLVVEDENDMAKLIVRVLEDAGYATTVAVTAAEAIQTLERDPHDAVVTDIRMPGASGLALLSRLRGRVETKDIPIVVVSGSVSPDMGQTVSLVPRAQFVKKPFSPAELIDALQRVMGHGA